MINEHSIVYLKLSIQDDGEEFIIGDVGTQNYIKVPLEAVHVVNFCNGNNSIKEIQEKCPDVDVLDFILTLHELNLVFQIDDNQLLRDYINNNNSKIVNISSKIFFNLPAYIIYCSLLISSVTMILLNKTLIPQINDFFVIDYMGVNFLIIFITSWLLTFIHELGHYLAASKFKVPVTFNLSLRMYWLVVEANMTNLWSVSKKERYIAFLGGIMFDSLIMFSVLIGQIITSHPILISYFKLITLVLVFRFLWHFLIFLRTDLYYIVTNFLNISNLHENARKYLLQKFQNETNNEFKVPESEMVQTKIFASFYIVGIAIAFFMLFGYSIPIILTTIQNAFVQITEYQGSKLLFSDGLLTLILLSFQGLIWLKGALNKIKSNNLIDQNV